MLHFYTIQYLKGQASTINYISCLFVPQIKHLTNTWIKRTLSPFHAKIIIKNTEVPLFPRILPRFLLHDANKKKDNASSHETIKCSTHEERGILSRILPLSTCHYIIVLPCVTPLFSNKYWRIDIRDPRISK